MSVVDFLRDIEKNLGQDNLFVVLGAKWDIKDGIYHVMAAQYPFNPQTNTEVFDLQREKSDGYNTSHDLSFGSIILKNFSIVKELGQEELQKHGLTQYKIFEDLLQLINSSRLH